MRRARVSPPSAKRLSAFAFCIAGLASALGTAPGSAAQGAMRSENVLYQFGISGLADGKLPMAGVVADPQGRLYGTTYQGGAYDYGTVYRLTPPTSGQGYWTEEILHSFTSKLDGSYPKAAVVLGTDGSVYGTALEGGLHKPGYSYAAVRS